MNDFIYGVPGHESYYGGFRTRTFADIWPSYTDFHNTVNTSAFVNYFSKELTNYQTTLQQLYYLLYARYGNSHIAYSDENQFTYAVLSTIMMYGPTWAKRLDIQSKLRALSEQDILSGGKAIYNHAFNPNTEPSTATLEELQTINDQNTTNYKKSKLEGYSVLMSLLETDVTAEFLDRFKKFFKKVVAPDYPLLYITHEENEI